MARITVEDCIDKFESRFELVLVASNRARKLHSGENPTVEKDNDKNTVIALREIAEETISIDEMKNNLIEEYQTVSPQIDEELAIEDSESDIDLDDNDENNKDQNTLKEMPQSDESQESLNEESIFGDDQVDENLNEEVVNKEDQENSFEKNSEEETI